MCPIASDRILCRWSVFILFILALVLTACENVTVLSSAHDNENITIDVLADSYPLDAGSVTGQGSYNYNDSVTLNAVANAGYAFVNWSLNGTEVSTESSYRFTAVEDRSLLANFSFTDIINYTIAASSNILAGGSVTGTGNYHHGDSVTLTASPNPGYNFVNWTHNGIEVSSNSHYSFTATEDYTLLANFIGSENINYIISVNSNSVDGGSVTGAGSYHHGDSVTLTASPNTGYSFVNWTRDGAEVASSNSYHFTAVADAVLQANFVLINNAGDAGQPIVIDVNYPPVTGSWYLPDISASWQWQLSGTVNTSYDVTIYDIDLFDAAHNIATLQEMGKKVICYFSAGSSENWRPDFADFLPADMGNDLAGWPGERWLDVRSQNVRSIMQARLDLAAFQGCDGVEPDNMDGYTNKSGFNFTADDQLDYNRFIANEAHLRGLSVGLKNDVEQIGALVQYYDFAVNEQCFQYAECDVYKIFTDLNKPVFNAEYPAEDSSLNTSSNQQALCQQAAALNIRTLILPLNLNDSFRISCD